MSAAFPGGFPLLLERADLRPRFIRSIFLAFVLTQSVLAGLVPATLLAMPAAGLAQSMDPAVDESSGAARYSIPIFTPPGPGGLAPRVALTYSSRRGDGPFGVGWDLGLGAIVCSTRFGVPNYADCEKFELDGQVLIEDPANPNVYHSFVETFERIEYKTDDEIWEVTATNGTIRRYGVSYPASEVDTRIMAGGEIAAWLLAEVEDPFENKIFYRYDGTTDDGTRYPVQISYGVNATRTGGDRSIILRYDEDRLDPIHDFQGGIERELTKRLTMIEVWSHGSTLARRYAFGYEQSEVSYSTGRTRLSWVQEVGGGCTGPISECSRLPRREFFYTDPNDDGTTAQFSKFTKDSNYVVPFSGNAWVGAPPVRMGDVNGDGLVDLIEGGRFAGALDIEFQEARVRINTGSGFVVDTGWTLALNNLVVERPRAAFYQKQAAIPSGSPYQLTHTPEAGIYSADYSVVSDSIGTTNSGIPARVSRAEVLSSTGAKAAMAPGLTLPGWIEGQGRLFLSDVNADGLADIIVSIHLSGVDLAVDSAGVPRAQGDIPRVAGRTVTNVYLNTGDPAQGWVKDENFSSGLPPFDLVLFESAFGTQSRLAFDWEGAAGLFPDPLHEAAVGVFSGACSSRGLGGWEHVNSEQTYPLAAMEDVCFNVVDLAPRFQDLNGDGFVDLIALELDEIEALHQGKPFPRGPNPPALDDNNARSRAWIQDPSAKGSQPRWVRAPQYDLPDVAFLTPAYGGALPEYDMPFAHGQPQLFSGYEHAFEGGCPGPNLTGLGRSNWPVFEFCSPLTFTRNLGVHFVDVNRDGLADVVWSLHDAGIDGNAEFPLITQGVLLNTGTGWCSSLSQMAPHVESECSEALRYLPPTNSPISQQASGFALFKWETPGSATGNFADLNSDGWLDYIQTHAQTGIAALNSKAWLYDPSGASQTPANVWARDSRYDLDIDYGLINTFWADFVSFSVVDINGDGLADVVGDDLKDGSGTQQPQAFVSNSRHSDLLRLVRNGVGGEIAITYESAIRQRDALGTGLETIAGDHAIEVGEDLDSTDIADVVRWTSQPVVSEVRIAGPNREPDPASATGAQFGPASKYKYAHPRYCTKNRSDLGFRVVEKTRPGGEVVTSRFYQTHGRAGKKSSIVVSENGFDMHVYKEYWETQEFWAVRPDDPTRPLVPELVPGSIDDPTQFVGRLARVDYHNSYGMEAPGAQYVRTYDYDANYGYNFVERTTEVRPTSTLVVLRAPYSDPALHIYGSLAEEKRFDYHASSLARTDFLSHQINDYTLGRLTLRTQKLKKRDATGAGTSRSVGRAYDSHGNLTMQTLHGTTAAQDQVTDFCFDGSAASWCPNVSGQASHSVRVGMRVGVSALDPDGIVTGYVPDPATGSILEIHPGYEDVPSTRVELDVFGRVIEEFVKPMGGAAWFEVAKNVYTGPSDPNGTSTGPPIVERLEFPNATTPVGEEIWSATVLDGFGRPWKSIVETPTSFSGTLVYHDASRREMRRSLPIDCVGDSLCTGFSGETQPFASIVALDALGRPIRRHTPLGFSLNRYSRKRNLAGPDANGDWVDVVLHKNGEGHLTQRAFDGDRVAWVNECGNTVSPSTETLGPSITCTAGPLPYVPTTFMSYEATGEVDSIYDAMAESPYDDPNHYLRYHYDTLGRIVQIDDPALSGSGHSTTTYDEFGNVETVTNARNQARTHTYDELNRMTGIATPTGEADYSVTYTANQLQPTGDFSDDYERNYLYDEYGRVKEDKLSVQHVGSAWADFYTDYTYDLLGRVVEVLHPEKHSDGAGSWIDTIVRYEYDRGYLDKVCDLGTAADCNGAGARSIVSVGYDGLGRRERLTLPGGTRTFEYDPDHRLLTQDSFSSGSGGSYGYTRDYLDYDAIGNITSIGGSETGASPVLDMVDTYVYDQRNRVAQWSKSAGPARSFDYDPLGNLILHQDEPQVYDDPQRPTAIKQRQGSIDYAYDDDGNVISILGGPSPRHFEYDSANRIVCNGDSAAGCGAGTRVIYDVKGGRVAERLTSGISDYNVYIGDAYVHEHRYSSDTTDLEIKIGGERIALKRFNGSRRGSSASVFPITFPLEFWFIGLGGLGGWLAVRVARRGEWVLVYARPIRAAMAMGAAGSLLLPSIAMAGGAPAAVPPAYYWEISDQLGTGMVLLDETGGRVRHQTFSPFGRVEQETGPGLRTFYAGHRRDEESGMFHMQARWYDPGAGRFSSVDPLIRSAAVPQSVNPYSYAENNPVNGYDPTGLLFEWFISQDPATNEVHVWTQSYSPSSGSGGAAEDSGGAGAAGSSGAGGPGSGGGASLSVGVSVPGAGVLGSGTAGAPSSAPQFQSGSGGSRSGGAGDMDLAKFESPGLHPSPGAVKTPGGAGAIGAEEIFELFDGGARSRAKARINAEIAVRRIDASRTGGSRDVYAFVTEESIVNVATGQRRFVDLTLGQNVYVPAGTLPGHVPVPHSIYPGQSGFFQRVWIPRGPALIFRTPFLGPGL